MSFKSYGEDDCKEEQRRTLAFIAYSDNMGKGEVVYNSSEPDSAPKPIVPDSMAEALWEMACGKK